MAASTSGRVKLSDQQESLKRLVVDERKNVMFSGCGGTGKSLMVGVICRALRQRYGNNAVAVTATTGRAAFNIRGVTIHSFAGVGLATEAKESLAKKLKHSKAGERWRETKVLIVDEVSMMSGELFDKLEYVARAATGVDKRFGGIQLVLVGDFLQLPPVGDRGVVKKAFQADAWTGCIDEYVYLTRVFRQQDMPFVRVLTLVRLGVANEEVNKFMSKLSRPVKYKDGLVPVNLYATRVNTDAHNEKMLSCIDSDVHTYISRDFNKGTSQVLNTCPAPQVLRLKAGAQVMLVKNISEKLVNGTVGIITRFMDVPNKAQSTQHGSELGVTVPVVRFDLADGGMYTYPVGPETWETAMPDGAVVSSRRQIPLILAWAITIHKSQGQTIQRLRIDMSGIFEFGQAYTALSRAVSPDSLEVVNYSPNHINADNDTLGFCSEHNLV